MRHSQRGITLIGWVILLIPVAIILYAGIRVIPMYVNAMNVSKALSRVAEESRGDAMSNPVVLRTSIEKNFDVQSIEHPSPKDLDVHREGDHMAIIADYEDVAP